MYAVQSCVGHEAPEQWELNPSPLDSQVSQSLSDVAAMLGEKEVQATDCMEVMTEEGESVASLTWAIPVKIWFQAPASVAQYQPKIWKIPVQMLQKAHCVTLGQSYTQCDLLHRGIVKVK